MPEWHSGADRVYDGGLMTKCVLVCMVVAAVVGCKKKQEASASSPASETAVEPAKTEAPPPAAPDAKLVERGAYVAKASACVICHTAIGPTGPDLANAFAGGLEMPDAIGTWRTPNITQDKSTGIGNWTDEQIIAAVREGVRPDGTGMYAIMPFVNYSRMTDDDAKALVAYLRTIKPIAKTVAPNKDLKIMKGPGPKPANAPDDATDKLKHGEYLASLMLCSHCHWTPDMKTMAPAGPDKMFSGGLPFEIPMLGTGKLWSRNITSDPETGIGTWTEDQIFTTIKTMVKPDGKMIYGPMQFMQGPWSQLTDDDLHAVAAYIKSLPPVKNKVPDSTFKPNAGPPSAAPAATGGTAPAAPAPTKQG
jgi:mono/diheme cytochrome c family protein